MTYCRLYNCGMTDAQTSVFDAMPNLLALGLTGCKQLTTTDFLLSHKDNLEALSLYGDSIGNDAIPNLTQLQKLKLLIITDTQITDFSVFSHFPNLGVSSGHSFQTDERTQTTRTTLTDTTETMATSYTFPNPVKDLNGNPIAPDTSNKYTYDAASNRITLSLTAGEQNEGNITWERFSLDLPKKKLTGGHTLTYTITSPSALQFKTTPNITTSNLTSYVDEAVSLYGEATGSSDISYQWYKDGKLLAGRNLFALSIPRLLKSDTGSYHVVATDNLGKSITSDTFQLTVKIPFSITSNRYDATVTEGDYISFQTTVRGDAPLTCQWYKDDTPIAHATTTSLNINNVTLSDAGIYRMEAHNAYGDTIAKDFTLTVLPKETTATVPTTTTVETTTAETTTAEATTAEATTAVEMTTPVPTTAATETTAAVPTTTPAETTTTAPITSATTAVPTTQAVVALDTMENKTNGIVSLAATEESTVLTHAASAKTISVSDTSAPTQPVAEQAAQTGDTTNPTLYIFLSILALLLMIGITCLYIKKRK